MKLRWMTGILMAGVLMVSASAQADHPQIPGGTPSEPSNDSAVTPNLTVQPQDALNAYEKQMAFVTVQTSEELTQIVQAVRTGQISSDQAEHLSRRSFELSMIRLQFLDALYQIVETTLPKEGPPAKPEEQPSRITTSEQTLVVEPPTSSPDIPESMARYVALTPAQIAAIQARVSEEQKYVQPLLQQLVQNRKALAIATQITPSSNNQIRKLAIEQSHVLERLIIANSQLQRDISGILTVEQRKKLDDMGQDTTDVTKRLFAER